MPHDLIMKNPFILEKDVFDVLINSINKKASNYYYLFSLPIHNKNISEDQIIKMGECLKGLPLSVLDYADVKQFINNNLKLFNNNTLDYLYSLTKSDNQFNTLHWEKFPDKYQMKFLKSKDMNEVLKILTNYSCTWTIEQKESFLKEYTSFK